MPCAPCAQPWSQTCEHFQSRRSCAEWAQQAHNGGHLMTCAEICTSPIYRASRGYVPVGVEASEVNRLRGAAVTW
jgi:hypothetical protein